MKAALIGCMACLVLAAGCGKYGAPVRPEAPSYDEGRVYDAGQPLEPGRRRAP